MLPSGRELNEWMPTRNRRRLAVVRFLARGQCASEAIRQTVAREETGLCTTGDETVWAGWSGRGGFEARRRYTHQNREQPSAAD